MMKFVSNQKGFSIIQGMVFASVLAGTALVTTRLLEDQKAAQKGAETRDQIEQLHTIVYSTLQNKVHCTATYFHTANGLSATPASLSQVSLTTLNTQSGPNPVDAHRPILFQVNPGIAIDPARTYMNNNVIIKSMRLTYPNFNPPGPPGQPVLPATLAITYRRLDKAQGTKVGFGAKDITKNVPIVIQRNAALTVISCYAGELAGNGSVGNLANSQTACSSLGAYFYWDPGLNTCTPKNHTCGAGLIFTGISSSGAELCAPLQNVMDLSNLIDSTSRPCNFGTATAVRFEQIGDKVRIRCN